MKNWWLLALCGVFDATYACMNFFMQRPDGSLALRTGINYKSTIVNMGMLALAAGVCTIAAGIWSSRKGRSSLLMWLLILNGLACSALGLILNGIFGFQISFRTIALLIVAMALSIGIYELAAARTLRRLAEKWLLDAAGVVSVGFALAFVAFMFRWIKLDAEPGSAMESLRWIGSYFGFAAICMLGLAARASTRLSPPFRSSAGSHSPAL